MVKKLFALASLTALTGAVASVSAAGCSSTPVTPEDEGGTPTTDAGPDVRKDQGVPDTNPPGTGTCPTTEAIDQTQYQYKGAAIKTGDCTSADIDALVAYVDANKTAKYADVKNSVTSATCKACLFTVDGATWGPLVENAKGELILINSGGCIEAASGKLECGKAYHQFEQCLDEACVDCPEGDDTALSACFKAAAKGACKAANTAITSDCADAISTCSDLSTKYTFEAPAKALCVGISDAGDGG